MTRPQLIAKLAECRDLIKAYWSFQNERGVHKLDQIIRDLEHDEETDASPLDATVPAPVKGPA